MKIDRIHFYVEDAKAWRDWFVSKLGFQTVASYSRDRYTDTEVVKSGFVCFALSSPRSHFSPVWQFLRHHPPGVADVAFVVEDLEAIVQRAIAHGAKVLHPPQLQQGYKWSKISAWGSLAHTLIERRQETGDRRQEKARKQKRAEETEGEKITNHQLPTTHYPLPITNATQHALPSIMGIDHIVLNVAAGDLETAVAWYKEILDFRSQQAFTIQTDRSALHSQVMVSSNSCVQFPINQPASPNSQIQEFLDCNQGAGIQHIALKTSNIIEAIAQFRNNGVSFLSVPPTYYTQLKQRLGLPISFPISVDELQAIAQQQILVDWQDSHPDALLLQTFTQPIFTQPTFFFEIIERRSQATGFGEGNFRALFEAIEREQMKRGSLQVRESGIGSWGDKGDKEDKGDKGDKGDNLPNSQ
ncbi:4-hydroxyphenylpyruvate dioxygenase family protein [Chroococcidiopsis sp. CCNUC1]|jgi:4-hydroxyphenylpyruvate dioxygenase|uniref:4-hydroxyphenylpyruvate dioxygenase family protein n=1 Tax=Chroococcidiopsis sp. CCNUC1 TaxID=2653189 RepID=UPI002020BA0C|nr:VOC family protein [Chroococcidiopsis sp. CCNUC1]URD51846.1 VOC family protein [Chroococcidiopsis sp. CCNUC1]